MVNKGKKVFTELLHSCNLSFAGTFTIISWDSAVATFLILKARVMQAYECLGLGLCALSAGHGLAHYQSLYLTFID